MQESGRVLFFESVPSADSISTPFWLHFLYLSSIYGVENKDWKSGILTVILESCDKFAQFSVSRHSLSEASHETLKLSSLSQFIIIILLCSSLLEEPSPICRLFVLLSTLRSINVSSASPSSSLCPLSGPLLEFRDDDLSSSALSPAHALPMAASVKA